MSQILVGSVVFLFVLTACSGLAQDDATSDDDKLGSQTETVVPDGEVLVADVFGSAGADGELAACYQEAYADAGVVSVAKPSDLANLDVTPELQAALDACLELVNP